MWIDIKDRLPEEGDFVLIFEPLGRPYEIAEYRYYNESLYFMTGRTIKHKASHWMPLPNPPGEENVDS
jgi:hypothetical protein